MSTEDNELDPRIQIELENLNSATDEINKLEIELEEANTTFRILLNESTRRLKLSSKKLGNCIEKARPYHDALEKARDAQIQCQKAAVKFQRANEIHIAAKETVALAEQRFMSNSHEWKFDNAWQEMLNHATQKVMDAEKQKADCHAEHQQKTKIFHAAEQKVQQLEERYRRSIGKSRSYFEEKEICQDQLKTQKERVQELQAMVQTAKSTYSTALRNLERISNDIHRQRGDFPEITEGPPPGPREPGVGAELNSPISTIMPSLPDYELELEKCDYPSIAGSQASLGGSSYLSNETTTAISTTGTTISMSLVASEDLETGIQFDGKRLSGPYGTGIIAEKDLEELRQKVRSLAVRPIEGGDGQQERNDMWEHELNATVDKLDHLMLLKECAQKQQKHQHPLREDTLGANEEIKRSQQEELQYKQINKIDNDNDDGDVVVVSGKNGPLIQITKSAPPADSPKSLPGTPQHLQQPPIKKLQKGLEPVPSVNVSMRELPLLARLSNEILDQQLTKVINFGRRQRRRSLD